MLDRHRARIRSDALRVFGPLGLDGDLLARDAKEHEPAQRSEDQTTDMIGDQFALFYVFNGVGIPALWFGIGSVIDRWRLRSTKLTN